LDENEAYLPVLTYISRDTLCLQSYTLSIGHAKALANSWPFFQYKGIKRVIFDNCGIDD
jgi:hypothetical protein